MGMKRMKYAAAGYHNPGGMNMAKKYRSMQELDASLPDKHEVAEELGIPLDQGHNEDLTTREVGKIGGKIGGQKVKKLIEMAEAEMSDTDNPPG